MLFYCFLHLFCIKTNYSSPYYCACGCHVMIIISLFSGAVQVDLKVMDRVLNKTLACVCPLETASHFHLSTIALIDRKRLYLDT